MHMIVNRQFNAANGAWPWEVRIQLLVSEDERSLVEQYRLGKHVLRRSQVSTVTLDNALSGTSVPAPSLEMMMQVEQDLRQAVGAIPAMLDYLRSFDSQLMLQVGGPASS